MGLNEKSKIELKPSNITKNVCSQFCGCATNTEARCTKECLCNESFSLTLKILSIGGKKSLTWYHDYGVMAASYVEHIKKD